MRIGKGKCERKTYPRNVCPDRNRIRLRVNGGLPVSRKITNEQRNPLIVSCRMVLVPVQSGVKGFK